MELIASSKTVQACPIQAVRKPVVLLIEADDDLRLLFRTALEMQGLEVIEEIERDEVIDVATCERVDLVLMDYGCSRSACLDTLRSIRQEVSLNKLPIFVLSSYAETAFQEQACAAGCNEFFVQPVDLFNLGKAVEKQIYIKSKTKKLAH
jgi:CheY-like chemotaxis protein